MAQRGSISDGLPCKNTTEKSICFYTMKKKIHAIVEVVKVVVVVEWGDSVEA